MKLIYAIVSADDGHEVTKKLNKQGFFVTKLSSSGGFLRVGNKTLMLCVDDDKVDLAIKIIEETCQTRKQLVITPELGGYVSSFSPYPAEVETGGATIIVTGVEKFEKV